MNVKVTGNRGRRSVSRLHRFRLYVAGMLARCGELYAELLANADRHGDKSVASRNIIDLAMMIGR
jgi:hypothetical protein